MKIHPNEVFMKIHSKCVFDENLLKVKGEDILFTGQGGRRHVTSKAKQRTATHFSTSRQLVK